MIDIGLRNAVMSRAKYACEFVLSSSEYKGEIFNEVFCGRTKNLEIHHTSYGGDSQENLLVLCREHHQEIHTCKSCGSFFKPWNHNQEFDFGEDDGHGDYSMCFECFCAGED